jgi:hypothetical protein
MRKRIIQVSSVVMMVSAFSAAAVASPTGSRATTAPKSHSYDLPQVMYAPPAKTVDPLLGAIPLVRLPDIGVLPYDFDMNDSAVRTGSRVRVVGL